jgi:Sulfotransferase family
MSTSQLGVDREESRSRLLDLVTGSLSQRGERLFAAAMMSADRQWAALDSPDLSGGTGQCLSPSVVILGPPRSGTTFLQRRLAQSADLNFLPSWVAWGGAQSVCSAGAALREATLAKQQRLVHWHELDRMHSVGLNDPEECLIAMRPWLRGGYFELLVPGYLRASAAESAGGLLTEFSDTFGRLLVLYGLAPDRLVLKNPMNMCWPQDVAETWPDAHLVVVDRDDASLRKSLSRLLTAARAPLGLDNEATTKSDVDELMAIARQCQHWASGSPRASIVMSDDLRERPDVVVDRLLQTIADERADDS